MDKALKKAIVFDWNATLFDDIAPLLNSTNYLLGLVNHPPVTLEFFQTHYDIPFRRLYHQLGLDPTKIDRLIEANNTLFHDSYEKLAREAELREGASWLLQYAKAHQVDSYILSNHLVEAIQLQLRRLGIEQFFTQVLAYADRQDQQTRSMTKGEKLRRFLRDKDESKNKIIIVGDSVEEIDIAREQGFVSVAITGGCVSEQRLRAEKPDYIVHSLTDMKPILQEQGFAS